uniref:ABC-type xenobiotic transporter n=3 Tax=Rhizophora mucronata TaxID=61149 RepID=A0A2P2M4K3_RHIMU
MEIKTLICPNSPFVWDGIAFSDCFDNIVFGFVANVVTIVMILVLAIVQRKAHRFHRINAIEKVALYLLPFLGACLSFVDMGLLFMKELHGDSVAYHVWLLRSSRLVLWTVIIISSNCSFFHAMLCERLLCLWWVVKSLLAIVHLYKIFVTMETWKCLQESSVVLLDIMFGISINLFRIKWTSSKHSSMEDLLLSAEVDIVEGCHGDPENAWSYWDLMTFKFVTSVMNCGVVKQLEFEDLLRLPSDLEPSTCHDKLLSCWQEQQNSSEPFLFKAISCAYGWPYLRLGLLKVVNDCIGFAGPLLLNKLIQFLQQGSVHWYGYLLALSLGLTSILKSFLDTQYTFHLAKMKLRLRSGIMTVIFQKCLCITLAERSRFSEGEIQTFMSVDADRTVNLCNSFHDMWSLPLQIGVALYLLYTQVKFAFLAGLAITILLIPVNKWISELIASATKKMMKQKDERIRRSGEILTHIRTIKMYGWEQIFSSWVMETRTLEVNHLATRKYLDAWCVFFWATTPTLFSLFTFGLFALMGYQLDAATVFTCLALFNNLISPLNSFPWVINGLIDAFISIRRLSTFLCCSEGKLELEPNISPSLFSNCHSDFVSEDMAIKMCDACCAWSSSDKKQWNLVLNSVTLCLPKGSLVAVIGEVGSGKSSLLCAILGEMQQISGLIWSSGSVAYVPQVCTLFFDESKQRFNISMK